MDTAMGPAGPSADQSPKPAKKRQTGILQAAVAPVTVLAAKMVQMVLLRITQLSQLSPVRYVSFFSLMDSCQVDFWQDEVEPGQVDAPDSGAEGHRWCFSPSWCRKDSRGLIAARRSCIFVKTAKCDFPRSGHQHARVHCKAGISRNSQETRWGRAGLQRDVQHRLRHVELRIQSDSRRNHQHRAIARVCSLDNGEAHAQCVAFCHSLW